MYRALVTGIIPPEEHRELGKPTADRELVPSYYRERPFSRAWMRLTHIEPLTISSAINSFRKAAGLPNYRKALLQRFANKTMMEPSELRGMATTIWEKCANERLLSSDQEPESGRCAFHLVARSNKPTKVLRELSPAFAAGLYDTALEPPNAAVATTPHSHSIVPGGFDV